ncbi:MAG: hypothetical protein ACPGAO_05440 [Flavobacteriaceae bacterium]
MKKIFFQILVLFSLYFNSSAQTIFELDGQQSMLMTGKGPGQDATINPFEEEDCYVLIQNLGAELFSVRIQYKGEIVDIINVNPSQTKKIKLLMGQELYLDPEPRKRTRASVAYQKIE